MHLSFFIPKDFAAELRFDEIEGKQQFLPYHDFLRKESVYNWIYQTWWRLRQAGMECDLVSEMPQRGIIIMHREKHSSFSPSLSSLSPDLFIVNVLSDLDPHPSAHLHLVQNRAHAQRLSHSIFIPHWPHLDLIPRHPQRGNRFENICFFGKPFNLAPELTSEEWNNQLRRETGLYLWTKEPSSWNDYHDVDVVIAIRDFSRSSHFHKPGTKLYNAWHAGIPFIGGRDTAFKTDGHPNKDYLMATSPRELLRQLKRLKKEESLRHRLVAHGYQAATTFTHAAILDQWKKLIQETLPLLASQWQQKSEKERHLWIKKQHFFCWLDRFK